MTRHDVTFRRLAELLHSEWDRIEAEVGQVGQVSQSPEAEVHYAVCEIEKLLKRSIETLEIPKAPLAPEAKKVLDTVPDQVLAEYIVDMVANDIGLTLSSFLLAMHPKLREAQTEPLELFDYAVERLRETIRKRGSHAD